MSDQLNIMRFKAGDTAYLVKNNTAKVFEVLGHVVGNGDPMSKGINLTAEYLFANDMPSIVLTSDGLIKTLTEMEFIDAGVWFNEWEDAVKCIHSYPKVATNDLKMRPFDKDTFDLFWKQNEIWPMNHGEIVEFNRIHGLGLPRFHGVPKSDIESSLKRRRRACPFKLDQRIYATLGQGLVSLVIEQIFNANGDMPDEEGDIENYSSGAKDPSLSYIVSMGRDVKIGLSAEELSKMGPWYDDWNIAMDALADLRRIHPEDMGSDKIKVWEDILRATIGTALSETDAGQDFSPIQATIITFGRESGTKATVGFTLGRCFTF